MNTVLLVEDEARISSFLKWELSHEGFEVLLAATGREALEVFKTNEKKITIILLDIMLPELNGLEVLRRLRKTSAVPVIMLTARSETLDMVTGLDAGADDYIGKPFAIEELFARMRSVLRRHSIEFTAASMQNTNHDILVFKELTVDKNSFEAAMRGIPLTLTRTEFLLLYCLLLHKGEAVSRDTILTEVWGENHYIDENSVDVYIRYVRSKLDDAFGVSYITTIRGVGYTMKE